VHVGSPFASGGGGRKKEEIISWFQKGGKRGCGELRKGKEALRLSSS